MKTKLNFQLQQYATTPVLIQDLNLKVGEREPYGCHPRKLTVIVECIKDFNEDGYAIVDNCRNYVKEVYGSIFTSHLISSNWIKALYIQPTIEPDPEAIID